MPTAGKATGRSGGTIGAIITNMPTNGRVNRAAGVTRAVGRDIIPGAATIIPSSPPAVSIPTTGAPTGTPAPGDTRSQVRRAPRVQRALRHSRQLPIAGTIRAALPPVPPPREASRPPRLRVTATSIKARPRAPLSPPRESPPPGPGGQPPARACAKLCMARTVLPAAAVIPPPRELSRPPRARAVPATTPRLRVLGRQPGQAPPARPLIREFA
jgi:hypothetical protein